MRPLAPELPSAGTRPLAPLAARRTLPADADAWTALAAEVAEATDRAAVVDAVSAIGAALDVPVDLDGDLVVLQRTFGVLHGRAVRG
ncbi:hypothetical protein [Nitriliruptor alkaliphilus]|uniref:hypothetical protein n=1 Tax=Nitriliruptor alkaliphilus TaxID=427918 RepID=UPI000697746D|nr:hypothetical protein [Nitriliruptor alkaliphilus]